jgi:hypothetical protein
MSQHRIPPVLLGSLLLLGTILPGGCRDAPPAAVPSAAAQPSHAHAPQQGGVLAELGEEEYHLEFTHGDSPGVLRAFVMDGEAEKFVRVDLPSFSATVRHDGRDIGVVFQAMASSATGERVGDTAFFEAATGLSGRPAVTITVPVLALKGRSYRDIMVALPAQ